MNNTILIYTFLLISILFLLLNNNISNYKYIFIFFIIFLLTYSKLNKYTISGGATNKILDNHIKNNTLDYLKQIIIVEKNNLSDHQNKHNNLLNNLKTTNDEITSSENTTVLLTNKLNLAQTNYTLKEHTIALLDYNLLPKSQLKESKRALLEFNISFN